MLSKDISEKVLTIGCEYDPPKGGVAQVIYTYSKEVFPVFHFISNSGNGGSMKKLWQFSKGWIKTFFTLLCNQEIKIVHIHTASYNSFIRSSYFVSLVKFFNKKVVLHIHGGGFKEYYKTNPNWIKKKLLQADYLIALTDNWRHFFQKELDISRVETVNNIIPNPQIREVEKDDRLHLLFLGFIVEAKGIFDLVEVINKHKKDWKGKLMLHIGGNHEVERLLNLIKDYGLDELIQYEGWVSGDKKNEMLNLMDVYILPSYTEGMPISILEALSYGKPVLTTPVGGIPEIVNEKNGYLFSPGDHKAMYEIINGIISNRNDIRKKAKNARASIEDNLPPKISEILENVYNEMVER